MKIELEITRSRLTAALLLAAAASVLGGGAIAHAQSTQAATTTDTLVGSALNTLGNAVSALRNDVNVLQMYERVARASITSTGAVTAQTGSWIAKVDHPGPGNYVVRFSPGVFSAPPTCITTANASDPVAPAIECYGVTTTLMVCQATEAGAQVNTGLSLLCAGS